mmetsp:Transcript_91540/g.232921  ORF Transcript_91540/g.232921 Transcript_91540/m.232921 type:complete len:247 (+) Transcript_91540:1240-1980(+)
MVVLPPGTRIPLGSPAHLRSSRTSAACARMTSRRMARRRSVSPSAATPSTRTASAPMSRTRRLWPRAAWAARRASRSSSSTLRTPRTTTRTRRTAEPAAARRRPRPRPRPRPAPSARLPGLSQARRRLAERGPPPRRLLRRQRPPRPSEVPRRFVTPRPRRPRCRPHRRRTRRWRSAGGDASPASRGFLLRRSPPQRHLGRPAQEAPPGRLLRSPAWARGPSCRRSRHLSSRAAPRSRRCLRRSRR